MDAKIRLSQCMIVRNEEENIARALSWGREIVWEQIVVDTGSADRTVEIAESMGAKVYHYEWQDDFAAAKNYAIDLANGDWIAFLDADEYYNENDALKLWAYIEELERLDAAEKPHIIRSSLFQLDDEGKAFAVTVQDRVFRNLPRLRYKNRIHEELFLSGREKPVIADKSSEFSIYHTGYSAAAYQKTNKLERDISLLARETRENPENYNAWSYLGRELMQAGQLEKAKDACYQALKAGNGEITPVLRTAAYCTLMEILAGESSQESRMELENVYKDYQIHGEKCPDMEYWVGLWLYRHDREDEAHYWLEKALDGLDCYKGRYTLRMPGELKDVYLILHRICMKTDRKEQAVKYAVLILRLDRFYEEPMENLLSALAKDDISIENAMAVYRFLGKLYDYGALRDKLFLIKMTKLSGFRNLESLIAALLTENERQWLAENGRSSYYLTKEQCLEKYSSVHCRNETDRAFLSLMEKLAQKTREQLAEDMKGKLYERRKQNRAVYDSFLKLHETGGFWGSLNADKDDYTSFHIRAALLKEHVKNLAAVYERLDDYRSKKTLLAVINNWMHLDTRLLQRIRENDLPFFDTDLIPTGEAEICVCAGKNTGNIVMDFMESYGKSWKKFYCYEQEPESIEKMRERLRPLENVEIRSCEAGAVPAGEDIPEPVTFLLLDMEGEEREVLAGWKRHIREEQPKLAVSFLHGYENLWKIPEMIAEMNPDYRLYMRCYGEKAGYPEKAVLYAL